MPIENISNIGNPPPRGELEGARFSRSELVQEIVSTKPGFLVRYGIVLFGVILLLLIAVCWFIQYPDVVPTKAKLTSINAPKEVICKSTGKLVKLFIKEGDNVLQGQYLGYMESTSNFDNVIALSKDVDTAAILLDNNKLETALPYLQNEYANLGVLQQNYQSFTTAFQNFKNYLSTGFYIRKKTMLANDLTLLKKLYANLLQQKGLNTEDLALQQKTFDANQSLKNDKVISELDYRNETSKLISKKLTLPQVSSAIIANQAQQNEKLKEIAELENTIAQQKTIFSQALHTFKSEVDEWKQKYVLIAPTTGKVAFATFLQENQQVNASQVLCFVNPQNTAYYAEVYIPQANFGKVQKGQEVLLKFPAYPFEEYGSVKGAVDFISNIPTDSGYIAKVSLPQGLHTNYKKQVQYREGLIAQGEIITKNMRLLERFYYNMVKSIKK